MIIFIGIVVPFDQNRLAAACAQGFLIGAAFDLDHRSIKGDVDGRLNGRMTGAFVSAAVQDYIYHVPGGEYPIGSRGATGTAGGGCAKVVGGFKRQTGKARAHGLVTRTGQGALGGRDTAPITKKEKRHHFQKAYNQTKNNNRAFASIGYLIFISINSLKMQWKYHMMNHNTPL